MNVKKKIKINSEQTKKLIKVCGFTIQELCDFDEIGMSRQMFSRYLGRGEMPLEVVQSLSGLLGVSKNFIICDYNMGKSELKKVISCEK